MFLELGPKERDFHRPKLDDHTKLPDICRPWVGDSDRGLVSSCSIPRDGPEQREQQRAGLEQHKLPLQGGEAQSRGQHWGMGRCTTIGVSHSNEQTQITWERERKPLKCFYLIDYLG